MPVPPLTNELTTLIFEHLWSILSTDPSTGHLIVPRNAPFIFAPFLRVSKTWQQLAAPFWLAHVEAKYCNTVAFKFQTSELKSRGVVRSLHFDPEIPFISATGDPDDYESCSDDDYYGSPRRDQHYTRRELFEDEVASEARRWADLVGSTQHWFDAHLGPSEPIGLEQLEAGPRPALSRRRNTTAKSHVYGNREEEAARPEPAGKTLLALWTDLNAPRLRSLRINLPPGSSISDIARFAAIFPRLTQLHLTFLGPLAPDEVARELQSPVNAPSSFPALEVLTISALATSVEHLRNVVVPLLVKPTSASLTHLSLQTDLSDRLITLTSLELFEGCVFTNLQDLRLDSKIACSIRHGPSFLADAPVISNATVHLAPAGKFTVPPPSLEHLSLESATLPGLAGLKASLDNYWSGGAFPAAYPSSLRTVSLEFANTAADLEVEHLGILRAIVALGAQHGVAVLGSWWTFLSDDARDVEAYEPAMRQDAEVEKNGEEEGGDEESESEGSGEDDEMDWDAEEDAQFRLHWSVGKRRRFDFDNAHAALREHFPSAEAFEAAKAAMIAAAEPFFLA
ncbi:hypothetical protein JCM6882_009245 [Rhodosporidiobolus microsporus]